MEILTEKEQRLLEEHADDLRRQGKFELAGALEKLMDGEENEDARNVIVFRTLAIVPNCGTVLTAPVGDWEEAVKAGKTRCEEKGWTYAGTYEQEEAEDQQQKLRLKLSRERDGWKAPTLQEAKTFLDEKGLRSASALQRQFKLVYEEAEALLQQIKNAS